MVMVLGQSPPRKLPPTLILTLTLNQTLTLTGGVFSFPWELFYGHQLIYTLVFLGVFFLKKLLNFRINLFLKLCKSFVNEEAIVRQEVNQWSRVTHVEIMRVARTPSDNFFKKHSCCWKAPQKSLVLNFSLHLCSQSWEIVLV